MNRRRQLAVVFFSAVIVLVLGLIVYVANVNASQTIQVWVVKAGVTANAGAKYNTDNVEQVPVHAQPGDFAFTQRPPDGSFVFAINMQQGDIVRDNDLNPATAAVAEVLNVEGTVSVQAGDFADIFVGTTATDTTGGTNAPTSTGIVLIGHALPVTTVAGQTVTVNVPLSSTEYWATLSASTAKFYVQKTYPGTKVVPVNHLDTQAVISFMAAGAAGSGS